MVWSIISIGASLFAVCASVSAVPNPTCPASNGTQYTAINGAVYEIECGIDRHGNDIKTVEVYSNKIADCIEQCNAVDGCTDITMSGTSCYLKSKAGSSSTCSACRAARLVRSASTTSVASTTSAPLTTAFTSTFSIPTSAAAPSTASLPTIDNGADYVSYSTVNGYFLQDLNSTDASTFDYTANSFGLISQTYSSDCSADATLTQWQRFNRLVFSLNQEAASNVVYKLLFIGRHGEGYHNAAQTYYGTPAWNCYWSELDGNGTTNWADADLTSNGVAQALTANTFWASEISTQKIMPPQSYYVSPLTRCLKTANYTYNGLDLPSYYPFVPTVKELFREGISTHTCDHRSNKTYIHNLFPTYNIESTFTEDDEYWNGISAETSSAQDYRSKVALDSVFSSDPAQIVSITTHSGEAGSMLRVLGHRAFSLVTGAIIPVLVKAETLNVVPGATTTTTPWTTSAWCTNGPPLASVNACVCSNNVTAVATVLASVTAAF